MLKTKRNVLLCVFMAITLTITIIWVILKWFGLIGIPNYLIAMYPMSQMSTFVLAMSLSDLMKGRDVL